MKVESIIAVLAVEAIEPCEPFWTERLGFTKTAEVPHGDRIGFAMYASGDVVVMYQTHDSIADDAPAIAPLIRNQVTTLFIKVDDIDDVERRMDGIPVVMARRETFYGATEIGVREPGGHLITFAQFAAEA